MADLDRKVVLTEKIKRCIQSVLTLTDIDEKTKQEMRGCFSEDLQSKESNKTILFRTVKKVYEILQTNDKPVYLHELLEGSEIYLSPPETPERSAELEARIHQLRAEQANREYAQMTKGVDLQTRYGQKDAQSFGREMKEVNKQLVTIFNFLLTVAGAFTFGYVGSGIMYNSDTQMRIITGSVMAFVVFVADMYFIIKSQL